METPSDLVARIIQKARQLATRLALHFWDQNVILSVSNMSDSNEIVTTRLYYERLDSEPSPRRRISQQKRRAEERERRRIVTRATILCASILSR